MGKKILFTILLTALVLSMGIPSWAAGGDIWSVGELDLYEFRYTVDHNLILTTDAATDYFQIVTGHGRIGTPAGVITLGAGDLGIGGDLEVGLTSTFVGVATFTAAPVFNGGFTVADDDRAFFGTDGDTALVYSTTAAPNALQIGLNASRFMIISDLADVNSAESFAATGTDPTLYVANAAYTRGSALTESRLTLGYAEYIDNSSDGTLALNATATTVSGTLAVTGATSLNGAVNLGDASGDVLTFNGRVPDSGAITLGADGDVTLAWNNTTSHFDITAATLDLTGALTSSGLITGSAGLTVTGTGTFNDAVILGATSADSLTVNARILDASELTFGTDGDAPVSWNNTSAYLNIGSAVNITGTTTAVALTASGLVLANAGATVVGGITGDNLHITSASNLDGLITGGAGLTLTNTATFNDGVVLGATSADSITPNGRILDAVTLVFGTDGDVALSYNNTSAYLNIGGAVNITGAATIAGTLTANGDANFNGAANFNGIAVFGNTVGVDSDVAVIFGSTQQSEILWSDSQPSIFLGVDTTSNIFLVGQKGDEAADLGITNQTNPLIAVANAAWTLYGGLNHNTWITSGPRTDYVANITDAPAGSVWTYSAGGNRYIMFTDADGTTKYGVTMQTGNALGLP